MICTYWILQKQNRISKSTYSKALWTCLERKSIPELECALENRCVSLPLPRCYCLQTLIFEGAAKTNIYTLLNWDCYYMFEEETLPGIALGGSSFKATNP